MSKTISGTYANGYILTSTSFGTLNPFLVSNPGSIALGTAATAALYGQASSVWTVTNAGTISGGTKVGVELANGGTLTNVSGGAITGKYGVVLAGSAGVLSNAGYIGGGAQAGAALNAGGYVYNHGTIFGASGVTVAGGVGTVVNVGALIGSTASGVYLKGGGTVTNRSGGEIVGVTGVSIAGAAGTVINDGVINRATTAGDAVALASGFANRVVDVPGGSFYGTVDGGNAVGGSVVSTLEFGASTQQYLLSGLGTQFIDFGQVTFDAGSDWGLTGSNTLGSGVSLLVQGLLQVAGETLQSAAVTTISSTSDTAATVNVSGASAVWNETAPLVVGSTGGGSFNVTNRASASAENASTIAAVILGASAAGVGTLSVSGAGSEFTASGPMTIGQAGTGSVSISSQGTLTSSGIDAASATGGSGSVSVTGVELVLTNTGSFVIGDAGAGSLSIRGGGAVITAPLGGTAATGAIIANTSGANGSQVNVAGAGSNWQVTGTADVGVGGSGNLLISDGGAVTASALDIAVSSAGVGQVSVSDPGTEVTIAGSVTVGDAGNGELSLTGGSTLTTGGNLTIGSQESASGAIVLSGTGTFLDISGVLNVGTPAGGQGDITASNGASVHASVINGIGQQIDQGGAIDPAVDIIHPHAGITGNGGAGGVDGNGQGYIIDEGSIYATAPGSTQATLTVTGTILGGGKFTENGTNQGTSAAGILEIGTYAVLEVVDPVISKGTTTFEDDLSQPNTYTVKNSVVDVTFDDNGGTTASSGVLQLDDIGGFAGTVTSWEIGNSVLITGGTLSNLGVSNSNTLTFDDSGPNAGAGGLDSIIFSAPIAASDFALNNNTLTAVACFASGTRIMTASGPQPVEDLREGDTALTHDGRSRTIRWVGHRHLDLTRHPDPSVARPVRIAAGAFGDNQPSRTLRVSPDHALFVDGKLISARLLINGASIVSETECQSVTYHHVELDEHDILLAEGMPAESYLDTGNRAIFANGGASMVLHPDFAGRLSPSRDTHSCAPFLDAPDQVKPIWEQVARRAASIGFTVQETATTTDPTPRLSVDGEDVRPVRVAKHVYEFVLPDDAAEIRLLSRAGRPCDARPWMEDRRVLGLAVNRIRIRGGHRIVEVPLDGPAIGSGWWAVERDGVRMTRWTAGAATLVLPPTEGTRRILQLTIDGGMIYNLGVDARVEPVRAVA